MSIASYHFGIAARLLNQAAGTTVVEYRAATSGPWTTLADGVFRLGESVPSYDVEARVDRVEVMASLALPESAAVLHDGYQVRIAQDDEQKFTVRGEAQGVGQRKYVLVRDDVASQGPNRGKSRR